MAYVDFGDHNAAALLAAEETGLLERRQTEVNAMLRLLAWCDLHSVDPATQPRPMTIEERFGGDRFTRIGGDGTPEVSELCFAEYAIASRAGLIATKNKAAAALNLRHRLPLLWARVIDLDLDLWIARKIADLSFRLSLDAIKIVDASVAAGCDLPAGKLIELAEARIIEADTAAHQAKIRAEEHKTGVFVHRRRPGQAVDAIDGQADVRPITLRLPTAGSLEFTTTIDEVAHLLADNHVPVDPDDVPTMDQFRARAVEVLADPYAAVRLLDGIQPPGDSTPQTDRHGPTSRAVRTAIVHIHLSAEVLTHYLTNGATGLVRVEELGPMLLEQFTALVRHRNIELKPVIDLNHGAAINAYEHPAKVKERTLLRTGGDVFPHSTSTTRRLDHDHAIPYDKHGPPGQTGDHNDAPLTRTHHRAKTHLGFKVRQLGRDSAQGAYQWETPHGLVRVVTPHGTRTVEPLRDHQGHLIGEIYRSRIPLSAE